MSNKKSVRVAFGLLSLVVVSVAGCVIPSFDHPVSSLDAIAPAPELSGVFYDSRPEESHNAFFHIGAAEKGFPKGFLRVIIIGQPKNPEDPVGTVTNLVVIPEKFGDDFVLSIPEEKGSQARSETHLWREGWNESKVEKYLIVRLCKRADGYELLYPSNEFVEKKILSKELSGELIPEKAGTKGIAASVEVKQIRVKADSKELRAFVTRHLDAGLFDKKGISLLRLKSLP